MCRGLEVLKLKGQDYVIFLSILSGRAVGIFTTPLVFTPCREAVLLVRPRWLLRQTWFQIMSLNAEAQQVLKVWQRVLDLQDAQFVFWNFCTQHLLAPTNTQKFTCLALIISNSLLDPLELVLFEGIVPIRARFEPSHMQAQASVVC
jgi:hypothetical protein